MSNQKTTIKQSQEFSIGRSYLAKVLFEISVDTGGNNYLVIYGKHVNGYFCCIPNWHVGCEMAEPSDVFYNRSKLVDDACIGMNAADALAHAIKEIAGDKELHTYYANYALSGENEFKTIFAPNLEAAYAEAKKCGNDLVKIYTELEYVTLMLECQGFKPVK